MRDKLQERISGDVVEKRAILLRNYLESGEANLWPLHFPVGCCQIASLYFLELLRRLDGVSGLLVANAKRGEACHAWAEVDNWIVDLTADQFRDFAKPVFVARSSPWHCSWMNADRLPYARCGGGVARLRSYADFIRWIDTLTPGDLL